MKEYEPTTKESEQFINEYRGAGKFYCNKAEIEVVGNDINIMYYVGGTSKKIVLNDDAIQLYEEDIKGLGKSLGINYVYKMLEFNNEFINFDTDRYQHVTSSKLGEFIAYVLNHSSISKSIEDKELPKEYKRSLLFKNIVIEHSDVNEQFKDANEFHKVKNLYVVFDRGIKDVDFDVTNSQGESVVLYYEVYNRFDSKGPNTLSIFMQYEQGETYTLTLKDFVDLDKNATKKGDKYVLEFKTNGSKIPKKNKEIENIDIMIPENITKESKITIEYDGDLKPNEILEYVFKNSDGFHIETKNLESKTIDMKPILERDDYKSGNEMTIAIRIVSYDGYYKFSSGSRQNYRNGYEVSKTFVLP